jgi:hypothetical protein
MIIKSVIRGGYRAAADYMKEQGKNEKTRLVELSDPSAKNLDDAFHNMWVVASNTKCTKPLHHISINPALGERLTDEQLKKIVEHAEEVYGYRMFHHQRVIVEHVKDGRQHFHVIWNRVSLMTGRPVWPGKHWNKSRQICRDMEKRLGLKKLMPRKGSRAGKEGRPAFKGQCKGRSKAPGRNQARNQYRQSAKLRSKISPGTKQKHSVEQRRSHTARDSNAGILSMLNKIKRYVRKHTTSRVSFNRNSAGTHNRKHMDSTGQARQGASFTRPQQQQPLAVPKLILFKPNIEPEQLKPESFQPARPKEGGWPPAAVYDWKDWGHKNPPRFFAKWPELSR